MMLYHSTPFQIQVDSSLFATRGILTQMDTNGDRHPCAYLSKSLTKEQRNYDTGDRELLAIVWALNECRHYIRGSEHTTIILSDHDSLQRQNFHKPLDDEWLDGPYICPNSISNWSIFQKERTYRLIHYREDQTYVHKEQTMKIYYNFSFPLTFAITLLFFTLDYLISLNPGHESSYL
jgi:RNase H-like domain found in reverse transcriptase